MDVQRKAGNELLAISHNANLSDGHMYPIDVDSYGRPIDAAWAESRDRNERLIEIKQIKGASETHPALSPNDEFANFEILSYLLGEPQGRIDHIVGSYARQALKDGITMQDTQGYNPYKFGVVGASDSHNTGTPYRQDNFYGGHAHLDGTIESRMAGHVFAGWIRGWKSPAGWRAYGPSRTRALRFSMPCSARKRSPSAVRTSSYASSAATATVGRLEQPGLGESSLQQRRAYGRGSEGDGRSAAHVHRVGREGSHLRQSGSDPDRQGMDEGWSELREGL